MTNAKPVLKNIKEASEWASNYLGKDVSTNNISYLINYGKILKYDSEGNWVNNISNGNLRINIDELKEYYDNTVAKKEEKWKQKLGDDLDWHLSFDNLREKDTTKHVHRLHPYKGKFIPQLVEYFLDDHTDEFKKDVFFHNKDTILDPFMGSGTTLVQSLEMGMNSIGLDISLFNCLIAKTKVEKYDIPKIEKQLRNAVKDTKKYIDVHFNNEYNKKLKELISEFNKEYFPSPEYKVKVRRKEIDSKTYSKEMLDLFYERYDKFNKDYNPVLVNDLEDENTFFVNKWYSPRIRKELQYYLNLTNSIEDESTKILMKIILSRTARSCRATTHSDLATLVDPVYEPYYCTKHFKICNPIHTITTKLKTYTTDTIKRLNEFDELRKDTYTQVLHGDSRSIDLFEDLKVQNPAFYESIKNRKIDGIFTSPPYVGQIDYHEQHAYAYELFDIERKDELEIGPMSKGKSKKAQLEYIQGISAVLLNVKRFLKDDANIFIVANDKFELYRDIAKDSGLKIVNEYKRPVLNRTERDKQPYSEKIFHMKLMT